MRLETLIDETLADKINIAVHGDASCVVRGLTADSRTAQDGYIFAALNGTQENGATYIDDALSRGAVAVLTDTPTQHDVPHIIADNPRASLAHMAARFFAVAPSHIAAVTGTNGKTSVAGFVRQLCGACGFASASLGTLGVELATRTVPLRHTTPDPIMLHQTLRDLYAEGVTHLALEASSHGLAQYRLDGLARFGLRVAGFTNLSRDHLDYHADMESYFAAKARLFTELLAADGTAIVNGDTDYGARLADMMRDTKRRVVTTGAGGDLSAIEITPDAGGQVLRLAWDGAAYKTRLGLVGRFQLDNVLVALALAEGLGCARDALIAGVEQLVGAEGRMHYIGTTAHDEGEKGAAVYVDYAHTPDALETALADLKAITKARLLVVFGCGGARDKGKRAQMGAVATRHADLVIITDDNPRDENPQAIRADILQGATGDAREIGDRREAIAVALKEAGAGDTVLVAGKGHETGQTIGATTHDFKDADVIYGLLGGTL